MKHIEIQSDVEVSNPFAATHLKVGEEMETLAEELGLKISGLVTPYGLNCSIEGDTPIFKALKIRVHRKLENVTTDLVPLTSPHTNIIELNTQLEEKGSDGIIQIRRNGVKREAKLKLEGLTMSHRNNGIVLYHSGQGKSDFDLKSLGRMDWVKLNGGKLEARSLFIPEGRQGMLDWLNALEQLVKNQAQNKEEAT